MWFKIAIAAAIGLATILALFTSKLSPFTIAASVAIVIGVTMVAMIFDKIVIQKAEHEDKHK